MIRQQKGKMILVALFSAILVMGLFGFSAFAYGAEAVASGSWVNKQGITMSWSLDEDGTLTISGEGALNMPGQSDDFGLDKSAGTDPKLWVPKVPWKEHINSVKKVVISDGITSIGDHMLRHHTNMTELAIEGQTLTRIGKCAFYEDTSLETLNLKNCENLVEIGANASTSEGVFIDSGLVEVLLPPSLESISPSMLHWLRSNLEKVNLCELTNLKSIDKEALKMEYGTNASKPITDSVTGSGLNLSNQTKLETIGESAFRNQTGLDPILEIGSPELKSIANNAFFARDPQYGVLESLDLSVCSKLETIGAEAFTNQTHLTSVALPDAYTWVNKSAFNNTGLALREAQIAYCVGGNGALYNVKDDGSAEKVLNDGEETLYWVPTAKGDDPTAEESELPYTGSEQELVNIPSLRPETGQYSIKYTLDGKESAGVPKAQGPGTYTVGYTVTLPDGTTKSGRIEVTIADPKKITEDMLSLDTVTYEYDGEEHAPALTVKDGENVLEEDKDYTVDTSSVTSATDVGEYTITVDGTGGYTDSVSIVWRIVDTTPPVISGVEEGAEYSKAVEFTVTDLRLASVTLQKDSGGPQSLTVIDGKVTCNVTENGHYRIVAKDLSGNETIVSFTVNIPAPPDPGTDDNDKDKKGSSSGNSSEGTRTGDTFPLWALIALAASSAAGLAGICANYIYTRRKRT